jgi:hypothetical protein
VSAANTPSGFTNDRPKKRRWFAIFGANSLLVSILLHILFAVTATCLIVEHFQKKHINFHATEPPNQHTEVEHKVELSKRNNVESAPPDLKRIVTTDVSAITLPDVPQVSTTDDAAPTAMSGVDGVMGSGMGSGRGGGSGGGDLGIPSAFGSSNGTGLVGYLYDLKQTSDKTPTNISESSYYETLSGYLATGWDDSILEKYYKVKDPLYSSCFAVTTRLSEEAPRAFHVENEVGPGLWVIHYHGNVMAPESGDYRFLGFADNILVVKIGDTTVLDGGWSPLSKKTSSQEKLPFIFPSYHNNPAGDPHLRIGSAFHLDKDTPVNMDVLIGDDGGSCAFFLLIMKVGNPYEKMGDGTSKVPFFQLDTKAAPTFSGREEYPPYSTIPEPWQNGEVAP